jgi:hypothetical protein
MSVTGGIPARAGFLAEEGKTATAGEGQQQEAVA